MFRFVLKRGRETDVPRSFLTRLDLFKRRPELVNAGRYAIQSDVDSDVFGLFMTRLYGGMSDVGVTPENTAQLRALCDELGFSGFDDELRAVLGRGVDLQVRKELLGVRLRVDRHDIIIEEMQRRVLDLERQLQEAQVLPPRVEAVEQRLEATARAIDDLQQRDLNNDVESLRIEVNEVRSDVAKAVAEARREATTLRDDVQRLRRKVSEQASAADVRTISGEVSRLKDAEVRRAKRKARHRAPHVEVVDPASKTTTPGRIEVAYNSSQPFNGIIAHLMDKRYTNVHEVVTVTSSICMCSAPNTVNLGSISDFCSSDKSNSWICYDFRDRRVTPTSYSLKLSGLEPGDNHLKSWALEVSNDGSEGPWEIVDFRENNFDLNGCYFTRNFAISDPPSGSFRFFRLRQTGKSHQGNDILVICALELFGTLSSE